ncbi:hypothetical protein T484DRAFT_1827001 [Baffinella frigidus]|nr:hypothetical protein T484DRAFT_1827001 [Cryptophyta sp. CCMP2293]
MCLAPKGLMMTVRLAITAGVHAGSVTEAVSYDAAVMSSITNRNSTTVEIGGPDGVQGNANLMTKGGVELVLYGTGIGMEDYTAAARTGPEGCESSEWVSDSSLFCKTGFGLGRSTSVAITAGVRVGTMTAVLSYNSPALSGGGNATFGRNNSPSTGSVSMTVVGSSLGLLDYTGAWRVGSTACEASEWESDSSMRCLSSGGVFGTLRVAVTAGVGVGSVTEGLSYDVPMLEGGSKKGNMPSTGSVSMTVVGSGMGHSDYTGASRVGATACEASGWESDSSMCCLSSGGVFGTLSVAVTAGNRAGSVTEGLSYESVTVNSVEGVNLATDMSSNVTLMGSGLGEADYSAAGRVGATSCEGSTWVSDTCVRCQSSTGVGRSQRVSVTAGLHVGSAIEVHSYEGAGLVNNGTNFATATGGEVALMGSGLGVADYSAEGRVGATACEGSNWASDSSLVCMAASGIGQTLSSTVTVGVQVGSLIKAGSYTSYDAPTLFSAITANLPLAVVASVTLSGSGLGLADYSPASRVGGTAGEASVWHSDTTLSCKAAPGVGSTLRVSVTAAATSGSALSYDRPTPSSLLGNIGNTQRGGGSVSLTVLGSGMGNSDTTTRGRISGTACELVG